MNSLTGWKGDCFGNRPTLRDQGGRGFLPPCWLNPGVLFALLLFSLVGCERQKKQTPPWVGDLIMAVEMIEPLDPILPSHSFEIALLKSQVFETLVRLSSSGEPIPHLARRWEVTPDSLVYRFELRREVFFHPSPAFPGGKARFLTAEDVAFSLKRALSRKSFYYRYFDGVIEGMRDFSEGRSGGKVTGIRTLGTFRIEIRLQRPYPDFLKELANPAFSVVPRDAALEAGDEFGYHPIGTGPFRVARFSPDTLYLVRNHRYWGRKPHLPGIRAVVFEEPTRERLALQSEMLDWGAFHPDLAQSGKYQAVDLHIPHRLLLWVYNPRKHFPRKALEQAIDRSRMARILQTPGDSLKPVSEPLGIFPPPHPTPLLSPVTLKVHLDPIPAVAQIFQRLVPLLREQGIHLKRVRSFLETDLYMTVMEVDFDAPRALLLPFYGKASDLANPWDVQHPRLDSLIEQVPLSDKQLRACADLLRKDSLAVFLLRMERRRILVHRRILGIPNPLSPYTLLTPLRIKGT